MGAILTNLGLTGVAQHRQVRANGLDGLHEIGKIRSAEETAYGQSMPPRVSYLYRSTEEVGREAVELLAPSSKNAVGHPIAFFHSVKVLQ